LYQQQLHEGEDYLILKPTISISFLNHVLFPDVPPCRAGKRADDTVNLDESFSLRTSASPGASWK
jgi:hypothetical protein